MQVIGLGRDGHDGCLRALSLRVKATGLAILRAGASLCFQSVCTSVFHHLIALTGAIRIRARILVLTGRLTRGPKPMAMRGPVGGSV